MHNRQRQRDAAAFQFAESQAQVGLAVVAWLSLLSAGGLVEKRPWAVPLECCRLAVVVGGLALAGAPVGMLAGSAVIAVLSAAWLLRSRTS